MNEDIQDVRRLLAPANPVPRGTLAGAGQDATGRAAFARVTASGAPATPRRLSSRRSGVRLVAAGGLAVAITAGLTVTQGLGGADKNGNPRPVLPGLPADSVANAQVALHRAAGAAAKRAVTRPRPDQWIYTEVRSSSIDTPSRGNVWTPTSPRKTTVDRHWTRADGKRWARIDHGRFVISTPGSGPFPSDYAALTALPRDPDALLAWARRTRVPGESTGSDARAWAALMSVLNVGVLPPGLESATYRAMAKIRDVTVNKAAVDDQGRPALALVQAAAGAWLVEEILLDPSTYAYRGERLKAVRDHGMIKKGTIESLSALLAAGVVDHPGQRPSKRP
ncbi:CU044_5270 family protein [Actinoallomurus sp. NPDC050550]|uniref:CU044_5270 family protein n=1 Tax=Actinoallomurus sp. NPDC050550 TaxID=3154937 RepID=UPI0033EE26B9